MNYDYVSDKQNKYGFIKKAEILKYVTEEEIFELVFGYKPVEMEYVVSPFRNDTNPGAWFEKRTTKLRFVDYASEDNFFPDCFEAVQKFYDLLSFHKTLIFIYRRLIEGKDIEPIPVVSDVSKQKKKRVEIIISPRQFQHYDANYWKPYGISKQDLITDKVFAVRAASLLNTKKGDININFYDRAYAYTEFQSKHKKLYFPDATDKNKRFLTNCSPEDIGFIQYLPPLGKTLIVTKSYKDARVLRNQGRHVIWLQNETIIPEFSAFLDIVKNFTNVVVLYDNDRQGITTAKAIVEMINVYFPDKARTLWIPERMNSDGISDPADLQKIKGEKILQSFMNYHSI